MQILNATCFTSSMKGSSAAAFGCEIIKEKPEVGESKNKYLVSIWYKGIFTDPLLLVLSDFLISKS